MLRPARAGTNSGMIVLGIVLLIIGLLVPGVYVLVWIGAALILVGLILNLYGGMHAPVEGRRRYWY